MTTQPEPLADALARFTATRPSFPSPSEQALFDVLHALATEQQQLLLKLDALAAPELPATDQDRERRANTSTTTVLQPKEPVTQPVPLEDLRTEVATLRKDVIRLQEALDTLILVNGTQMTDARRERLRRTLKAPVDALPPRQIYPMEYWANNVPNFGEDLTAEEVQRTTQAPRVRPQDVTVTSEDMARQPRIRQRTTVRRADVNDPVEPDPPIPCGVLSLLATLATLLLAIVLFNLMR